MRRHGSHCWQIQKSSSSVFINVYILTPENRVNKRTIKVQYVAVVSNRAINTNIDT